VVKTNGGGHLVSKDATIEFSCGPAEDSISQTYEVVAIHHNFCAEMAGELPSEARLLSINVGVKKIQ
jgi:hypothetical protein